MKYLRILAIIILAGEAAWWYIPALITNAATEDQAKKGNLKVKTTKLEDHQIAYYQRSNDQNENTSTKKQDSLNNTPVVMLHGYGGNKDNWLRFASYLTSKQNPIIIPDLPGFGESSRLTNASYDIESQADRIALLIDKLQLRRVHLLGNSMGGHIAQVVALKYPEKVKTLGLLNSAGVNAPSPSIYRKTLKNTGKSMLVVDSHDDYDKMLQLIFFEIPNIPKIARIHYGRMAMKHKAFNQKIGRDILAKPFQMEEHLNKIEQRTLVLWGDHDQIIDVSAVQVFERYLQNPQSVILKNCGHLPMIEKPQQTALLYGQFIYPVVTSGSSGE